MLLSGETPRPKARSAHEGISPAGAVYRQATSASMSAPLAAFFFFFCGGLFAWRLALFAAIWELRSSNLT